LPGIRGILKTKPNIIQVEERKDIINQKQIKLSKGEGGISKQNMLNSEEERKEDHNNIVKKNLMTGEMWSFI
jgi:hypothetical protein